MRLSDAELIFFEITFLGKILNLAVKKSVYRSQPFKGELESPCKQQNPKFCKDILLPFS